MKAAGAAWPSARGDWRGGWLAGLLCLSLGTRVAAESPLRDVEPAVALARAAIRRAHAQPEVAESWLRRLRAAAWLPELRAGMEKDLGTREAIDPTDRTRYGSYALDELRIEARASWRLDRLVFDPEEVRASRESARLTELRQDLALLVIRLYYERRRLELEPADAGHENTLRVVRMEEITALLETLCGPSAREPSNAGR